MLRRVVLAWTDVQERQPCDGGDMLLRNVCYYKSHAAYIQKEGNHLKSIVWMLFRLVLRLYVRCNFRIFKEVLSPATEI
jgi:hypothetical protein